MVLLTWKYLLTSANIRNSIVDGDPNGRWSEVETAIKEYDQIILDLVASEITRTFLVVFILIIDMKSQFYLREQTKEASELLKWLAPLHSSVEDQLCRVQRQRDPQTLQWARNMNEFQDWRLREKEEGGQVLWVCGPPGFGKSTLAGYYVEILHRLYPDAIVAYFFCKSGAEGLVSVRDLIRSLAYQISRADENVRACLLDLKNQGEVDGNHGIEFLFEKLLLGSMSQTQKELFIVIDGLDEADRKTIGNRSGETEMILFLQALHTTTARLLFISRPDLSLAEILSPVRTTTVRLDKRQNEEDITKFVNRTFTESKKLRSLFEAENIDPLKYFLEHARGIFLWVAVTLRELGRIKSKSEFQNEIDGFSKASGSMDELYRSILAKLESNSRKWMAEILRWVVAAEARLSVADLHDAVRYALKDTLYDFEEFIDVDCGSLLQKTPALEIQLVHETFRSFLLNSEKCASDFHIEENEIQFRVASICIDFLTNLETNKYIEKHWATHLEKATSEQQSVVLLKPLHEFFTSRGLDQWIQSYLSKTVQTGAWRVSYNGLTTIYIWGGDVELNNLYKALRNLHNWASTLKVVDEVAKWAAVVASDRYELLQTVGKAAGRIFLYNAFENSSEIPEVFLLALKYYRRRPRFIVHNSELQELVDTKFTIMSDRQSGPIQTRNVAIAYYALQRWRDCLRMFNEGHLTERIDVWRYMSKAYYNSGDYDAAIQITQRAIAGCPAEKWPRQLLGELFVKKGDFDMAIEVFENTMKIDPNGDPESTYSSLHHSHSDPDAGYPRSLPQIVAHLLELYRETGKHDRAIEVFTRAVEDHPTEAWPSKALAGVFRAKHDNYSAIRVLRSAIEKKPADILLWEQLQQEYEILGDYSREVEVLREGIDENPTVSRIRVILGRRYEDKAEYNEALESYEQAYKLDPPSTRLSDIYRVLVAKGLYDRAIKLCEATMEKDATSPVPIRLLGQAYQLKGDHEAAVNLFMREIERPQRYGTGIEGTLQYWLGWILKKKGDIEKAIEVFTAYIDSDPTQFQILNALYELHAVKNDHAKMIPLFERAIKESPYDGWLWIKLASIYQLEGESEAANTAVNNAIEVCTKTVNLCHPGYSEHQWKELSNAFKANGDLERAAITIDTAITSFEARIEMDPRNDSLTHISDLVHPRMTCRECDLTVRGYRFQCLECPAYVPYCESCVLKSKHPDHELVSFPSQRWVSKRFSNVFVSGRVKTKNCI